MAGQFLTAVFEMRPTRRKAAVLERMRAKSERVFWDHLASVRAEAEQIVAIADGRTRTTAIRHLAHRGFQPAIRAGLNEPLAHALERDLKQQITSYIGLRRLDIKNETADGVAHVLMPRRRAHGSFNGSSDQFPASLYLPDP